MIPVFSIISVIYIPLNNFVRLNFFVLFFYIMHIFTTDLNNAQIIYNIVHLD